MTLPIGERIRSLRKARGLTQEQLADRLGVSFQSVSRWESCATYPDMELLPAIAAYFGVTTDSLLGVPETKKEEEAARLLDELSVLSRDAQPDMERAVEIIRILRREHLESEHFWRFWLDVRLSFYRRAEILPQIRRTVDRILESTLDRYAKNLAIEAFAKVEDEDKVGAFLDQYSADEWMTKKKLLYNRYLCFGPAENAEVLRKEFLFSAVTKLTGNTSLWRYDQNRIEPTRDGNRIGLRLLHGVSGIAPTKEHPITGGNVDFFAEEYLITGTREAMFLCAEERFAEAIGVLEDVAWLLASVTRLPCPGKLGSASPYLAGMEWEIRADYLETDYTMANGGGTERIVNIRHPSLGDYCVIPSQYYEMLTLTEDCRWYTQFIELFAPLRQEPAYQAICDRVRACMEIRPE